MCPACWKTNRPQDTRCYRCHTARNADPATIDLQRGAGRAATAKDDARGILEVFVALPGVVFSWYAWLMVLSAVLLLVFAALLALSPRGHLAALVLFGFAVSCFLIARALRWTSRSMRQSNPRGFLVGLVLSLVISGGELLGRRVAAVVNFEPKQIGKFMSEVLETAERTGEFKVHFASAREAFNMVAAAVDGKEGQPGAYRDYKLRQIMDAPVPSKMSHQIVREMESEVVLR